MLKELDVSFELQSDLQNTVDWGKKWIADFNAEKTQSFSFQSSKSEAIHVLVTGLLLLEETLSSKTLGLSLSSKLDQGS